MTLTELIAEVHTLTKRPDLEANVIISLRAKTLEAHSMADFKRDLVIATIPNPMPAEYSVSLALPTGFKKWDYIKPVGGAPLEEVRASDLIDSYGYAKAGIYYNAGTVTQLILSSLATDLEYAYYKYPVVTVANYASWIADTQPFYLVYSAAAAIHTIIGRLDLAQTEQAEASRFAAAIVRDNVTAEG